jgi:hypothetical protein
MVPREPAVQTEQRQGVTHLGRTTLPISASGAADTRERYWRGAATTVAVAQQHGHAKLIDRGRQLR